MQNDIQPDEFHGVGGSYVIDPDTGKRTPAPKAQPQPDAPAPSTGAAKPPLPGDAPAAPDAAQPVKTRSK